MKIFKTKRNLWKRTLQIKSSKLEEESYANLETIIKDETSLKTLIKIENIKMKFKSFKDENIVFKNLNFNIYEGENLAILGPNGSGKSVLIEIISGIRKPTKGKIEFLFPYKNKPYKELGVQFQDLSFPKGLTVKDTIDFIIDLSSLHNIDPVSLNEFLDIFQMKPILNIKASKLSGGQQQRLNLLLSLIHNPKILFLDEFSTGLDIAVKNEIQNFILKYIKDNKITLITISHDIESIEAMSDRIIILANKDIKIDLRKEDINSSFGSVNNLIKKYII